MAQEKRPDYTPFGGLRAGITTIIVATGGVEENAPYVVGSNHNYGMQTVLPLSRKRSAVR